MPPQVIKLSEADCALRTEPVCGESPVWAAAEGVLWWVDNVAGVIHRFHPTSGQDEAFAIPHDEVNCIGLRAGGTLVAALRQDVALFDPATGAVERLMNPESDKPLDRFNDGKVDRQGRFWAGTMNDVHWDQPTGSLYRLDPDGHLHRQWGDVVCANGLGWSPDNRTFYFGESFRYAIFAFDFDADTGSISNRRLFASIDRAGGAFPDGLTVDAEGGVWSVHNAVGRVVRYAPDGSVTHTVALPVPQPTSVIFGGAALDTLYITTSRQGMTPEQLARYPFSGSLFALRPGIMGLPEPLYRG